VGTGRTRRGPGAWWGWVGLAAAVAAWTTRLVRLPGPAVIDPDGHAAALYFQRLTDGGRLEVPLLSTPKPLLTLLFGGGWAVLHDWRLATLATMLAFTVAVLAAARAAHRLAGWPAAAAVAVALAGSGELVLQVARGNSVIWALAGWAVALDALARRDPERRWLVAGLALAAAGLARSETWLLLPALAIWAPVAWHRGHRGAGWLLLALVAPALWLGHDLALTGDVLYSARVPGRYTDLVSGRSIVPPPQWLGQVGRRYLDMPLQAALAVVGVIALVRRRAWLWLVSSGLLAVGVLTLLGRYASQGVYISWRYFDPPDVALRLVAAVGLAALAGALVERMGRRHGPAPRLLAGLLVPVLVAAAGWPLAAADPMVRSTLDRDTRLSANVELAVTVLRPEAEAGRQVIVSGPQRTRVALELDAPLTLVHDLFVASLEAPLDQALTPMVMVYHDADGDRPQERFAVLSRTTPGRIGAVEFLPVLVDPARGLYVLRVRPSRRQSSTGPRAA
jgi:hypothetical protein